MADEIKPPDLRRRKGEEKFVVDQDVAWEAAKLTDEEIDRIESRQSSPFDPKDKTKDRLAKILGDISVAAATKIVEKDQQVDEANIDGLTRLLNRAAVTSKLAREIDRCGKNNKFLTVALVDLDNLKQINDSQGGHRAGDEALVGIAKLLNGEKFRKNFDFAGRYGGDEILLVLPEAELADVAFKLNEVLEEYSKQQFGNDLGAPFQASLSIGAAQFDPSKNQSPSEVIASADRALYASKNKGRNQLAMVIGKEEDSGVDRIVLFNDFKAEVAREKLLEAESNL